jgi:internalin A
MCGKLRRTIAAVMLGVAGLWAWQQEQPQVVGSLLWAQEPREEGAKAVAEAPAEQKPTPLPEAIEKAWAAAGAEIGWMRMLHMGEQMPDIYTLTFVPRDVAQSGDIPAFRLRGWEAGLLAKLPEPQVPFGLDFTELPLTDRWLVDLRGLKNLQALNLAGKQVTDAGLKELAALKNLQTLDLGCTSITDAGLKELAALKSLQQLSLRTTDITDAGLKELAGLKNLQWLNLWCTKITDAGLTELAALKNLRTLQLTGTKITDAGLKELAGLKSLQVLFLIGTKVTDAGVGELRKALPNCYIRR